MTYRTISGEGEWGGEVGSSTYPATFNYNWGLDEVLAPYDDYIGFQATATIYAPFTGEFSFTVGSDDGSRLYVDGQLIVNHWGSHSYSTKSGSVSLTEGLHTISLHWYDWLRHAQISFSTSPSLLVWTETVERQVTEEQTVYEDVEKQVPYTVRKNISFLDFLLRRLSGTA